MASEDKRTFFDLIGMFLYVVRKSQPHFYVKVRCGNFKQWWRFADLKRKLRNQRRKDRLKTIFPGLQP